jgi:hypothetical protein
VGFADDPIRVEGLVEFQKALRNVEDGLQKQLRVVFNEAVEQITEDARRKVPVRTGKARGSVKAASSQREAVVKGGGRRVSYYPWLEFGGKVGREKSVSRPFVRGGRYIYPAWSRNRGDVLDAVNQGIVDLARNAGLEAEP